METYSQINQDLNVITFFNNENDLYFVDIGAFDGKTLSNTYLLEKKYKWTGICSEPSPESFKKLKACREVICDNNAVYNESGLTLQFSECHLLSGITNLIDAHTIAKKGTQIPVTTITLQDLLEKNNSPPIIHYLSLDTEGSEFKILQSVNLNQYKFLYINVEHNFVEPRRTNIKTLLENNGYLYKGANDFDDDYIHESTILGVYYYLKNYDKPIVIKKDGINRFIVSSPYWPTVIGTFKNGVLNLGNLGKGTVYYKYIKFDNKTNWCR